MAELSKEELESRQKATEGLDYVSEIISLINPNFSSNPKKVKEYLKEGFWKALEKIKEEKINASSPEEHVLTYNSSQETLEPVYFWILDKMNDFFPGNVEKLVDNFASSAGSGHFAEMGARATKMQEEGMKILGTINTIIKSIINIIYDLKEFEIRLSQYKSADSKNKGEAEAGLLALKQIWMDNVDIKRGRGSINMLAQDLNFVTIRDAFMVAKSVDDIKKMELNDRVKRLLEPRVQEFFKWKEYSGKELKKRYEVQRIYLKSQIDSLKLYTRWAKPYLRAASQLEMKNFKNPALVTAFSTTLLQLTLLGKSELKFPQEVIDKNFPQSFRNIKLKRKYYQCVLVDFYFRGIPERLGQNYAYGGRVEVKFRAFALNDDESKILSKKLEESDLNDALSLADGITNDSLEQLREDLEYFLKDEEAREEKAEKEEKKSDDVNPFLALFGIGSKKSGKKKDKEPELSKLKSDNYIESMVRDLSQKKANEVCFSIFDIYKKAHGMPSHPSPFD